MKTKLLKTVFPTLTIAIFFSLICLSACSMLSSSLRTPTQKVEAACATVGASVQVLTIAKQNGKLTASQEKAVDDAISVTAPVCTAPVPPTLNDAASITFEAAVNLLAQSAATVAPPRKE